MKTEYSLAFKRLSETMIDNPAAMNIIVFRLWFLSPFPTSLPTKSSILEMVDSMSQAKDPEHVTLNQKARTPTKTPSQSYMKRCKA